MPPVERQTVSVEAGARASGDRAMLMRGKNAGERIDMLNIIGAIVSGLIIGVLARYIYWGPVPMSLVATILLGIGGSLVAGLVTSRGQPGFQRAGCLASILGAMALIFIGRMLGIGL